MALGEQACNQLQQCPNRETTLRLQSTAPGLQSTALGPPYPCTHKSRLVSSGWSMSALPPIVLQNSPTARVGSLWGVSEHGALLALPPSPGDRRQIYDIRRELGLRSAGGWHDRRWSFDILGELSQVLGGGDEQNLVAGAAQAPQPEPVEL
jgi:hypothetical protein